jgi:hypothetical protein
MKRTLIAATTLAVGVIVAPAVASAQDDHPSQGENSTGRNEAGFGGGPHCHLLTVESNGHFEFVQVFPSHMAHIATGLGEGPFMADPDCDGLPD